MKLPSFISW